MLDNVNGSEYSDCRYGDSPCYTQDIIQQHIEAEVSRKTAAVQESYEKLQQKYNNLYDVCNNYYQAYIFSG